MGPRGTGGGGGRARELGYTLQGTSAARAAGSGVRGWEEAHSPDQLLPAGVKGPASREGPTRPGCGGLNLGVYLPVWPFLAPGVGGWDQGRWTLGSHTWTFTS